MPTHRLTFATCLVLACSITGLAGCGGGSRPATKPALASRYERLDPRPVPEWMKGTIYEQVDLAFTNPSRISNYGLVFMKQPTGDATRAPNAVREYLTREMIRRGVGSQNMPGFEKVRPDDILRDKRVAIVRVDGFIPAGAVKGQRIDVQVTALDDSDTTSLAGGSLYMVDLAENGANPSNPGNFVNVMADARGYVFVNPAYALESADEDPAKRRALTTGIVLNGGRVRHDRPLGLRVRSAEGRLSKMIEMRIDQLCSNSETATAQDEGLVYVKVPPQYRGDWEHFAGVILHTYFNADSTFAAMKARELAIEARKPDAALLDISYCFEALGRPALPEMGSLYRDPDPNVAFAAARAGAFIGDDAAEATLVAMARDERNPFHVIAVQTLSSLQPTPSISTALRSLLSADNASVRIEAYRGLVRNKDVTIFTKDIGDKFKLDIVASDGPPLIYATRVGVPRIAFIGSTARLHDRTFFTAMADTFSITPVDERKDLLTLFYRGADVRRPVKMLTTPDLAEVVARLGGEGPLGEARFDFTYGEIIALLGKLSDNQMLVADRQAVGVASFVLQEAPGITRGIDSAPVIPDGPRPIGDASPQASADGAR